MKLSELFKLPKKVNETSPLIKYATRRLYDTGLVTDEQIAKWEWEDRGLIIPEKENDMSSDILTEDEERRLMAEEQFKEANSYINQTRDYLKDNCVKHPRYYLKNDKELEKMRDEIAELPTIDTVQHQSDAAKAYFDALRKVGPVRDEIDYYCPDCNKFEFEESDSQMDYNRNTILECKLCGGEFTIGYLEDHGFYREDIVNHPEHYISKDGIESIDVIRAFTRDLDGMEAVCTANILKYMMRWKHKNGLEDLKKAQWYLNYLITEVEVEDNNE